MKVDFKRGRAVSFIRDRIAVPARRVHRWSSIRYSANHAWIYYIFGFCYHNSVRHAFTARPVSKLESTIKKVLKMDELVIEKAYKSARKHNRRSEDMLFFELDKYARIARLAKSMNMRSYIPGSNYSFIHRRGNKPREVFAAEPELKIIMAFLLGRIGPLMEKHLTPYTYNNRIGMGTQAAVNKVAENIYACSHGYTRPCWIIKLDYKGYFPNINQDLAYAQVKRIIDEEYKGPDKDEVYYSLSLSCFCNPSRSYRKSPLWEWQDIPSYKSVYTRTPGVGGFIGYHFWQIEASLYPADIDRFIAENITPYYVRFVDDCVLITDNKEATLAMIPELRRRLAEIGITLHPRKFYCQPYEHGVEFLGYHILPGRIHMKRQTIGKALAAAKRKGAGRRRYIDSINSYLGMIKGTSDLRQARAVLDAVRPDFTKDYTNYKIAI